MINVLIVEDESIVALEISSYVNDLGYIVVKCVSNSQSALDVINSSTVDLVLMDVKIKGDVDGISCASSIKEISDIPIIYISAFSDDETLNRAIQTQPSSYLIKPFNRKELKVAMLIAIKKDKKSIRTGDIVFDSEFSFESQTRELLLCGENIHLTKQEQTLLSLLVSAKN
ncbi:MAG: response regulator, partial [Campylobacterota bacterium]|nr:response regulator [Campylobacterota bacterium]